MKRRDTCARVARVPWRHVDILQFGYNLKSRAILHNLIENLAERGCRGMHQRRRNSQRSGAQHVVGTSQNQHKLIDIEALKRP